MVLVLKYLIYDNWEYKGCIKIYLFMSHLCYGIHITVLIENEELMRMESKFLDIYRIIQDVPDKVHQTFTDFCKL